MSTDDNTRMDPQNYLYLLLLSGLLIYNLF